ncbi:DUF1080 domain-containing protein [Novosphingobium resinovorum]|uniref:3-keto-disaccharide hydrolase n=1 Tax=Novosphingobium TaxID=165696 RepID=UPI001B3C97DF|nr:MULTISPECIES: DUF1080 domain-containing protein [Novosphingobium]MBF7011722.1 DUF1080 domain-containing protein [Novosphingobium sp. HR1a]WJM26475.1 DUF1080 domain-containing protein [Novosphingobium resinovorum]
MTVRRIATLLAGHATLAAMPALAAPDKDAVEMREISPGLTLPFRALAPGLPPVPDYGKAKAPPLPVAIPEGFTPIFNGRDLAGWHVSKTSRHGTAPDFAVRQGVLMGMQGAPGQGGQLVTDRKYRNFELSFDFKPDWSADSGVFFRTTEEGAGYQVTLDYVSSDRAYTAGPGLNLGSFIGEGGVQVGDVPATSPKLDPAQAAAKPQPDYAHPPIEPVPDFWKREQWNHVRIRVAGDVPHVTVWINGTQVSDTTDTANHAVGGMVAGPIALQVHGGWQRWRPGDVLRWRNIAIRKLPKDAK